MRTRTLSILSAGLLTSALASPALAGNDKDRCNTNPGVLPPQSHAYGKTYGEWSAAWWQWVNAIPVHDTNGNNQHPLWDTTGEDALRGQSGPVWFLAGMNDAFPDPNDPNSFYGIAEREVTIPTGKALFFPILNAECSVVEGNGQTEQELRDLAAYYINHTQHLACELDGLSLRHIERYRADSPAFTMQAIEDNWLDASYGAEGYFPVGSSTLAVSDGVYLMLAPLPGGEHELHFSGAYVFTADEDGFDYTFSLDITYHLTVEADGHDHGHDGGHGH